MEKNVAPRDNKDRKCFLKLYEYCGVGIVVAKAKADIGQQVLGWETRPLETSSKEGRAGCNFNLQLGSDGREEPHLLILSLQ